jgi:hypothetical protein
MQLDFMVIWLAISSGRLSKNFTLPAIFCEMIPLDAISESDSVVFPAHELMFVLPWSVLLWSDTMHCFGVIQCTALE